MKTLRFIGMAIIVALVSFGFTACSSSSDDEEDGGGGSTSGALIKKIMSKGKEICTFEYDVMGRVIKGDDKFYSYRENSIIVNGRQEHELSNGRIVKSYFSKTYTYDNNGYLKTLKDDAERLASPIKYTNYTFTWKNGNLIKYGQEDEYYTVTYSNQKWPKYWMHDWFIDLDEYLEPIGAWGKMPINLPSEISHYQFGNLVFTCFYEYVVEQGRITQLLQTFTDRNGNYSATIVYEYIY